MTWSTAEVCARWSITVCKQSLKPRLRLAGWATCGKLDPVQVNGNKKAEYGLQWGEFEVNKMAFSVDWNDGCMCDDRNKLNYFTSWHLITMFLNEWYLEIAWNVFVWVLVTGRRVLCKGHKLVSSFHRCQVWDCAFYPKWQIFAVSRLSMRLIGASETRCSKYQT